MGRLRAEGLVCNSPVRSEMVKALRPAVGNSAQFMPLIDAKTAESGFEQTGLCR
jgi:hypothetical protein